MNMLSGCFEVKMDDKGRFLLPSGIRKILPENTTDFVMNTGFDGCVLLYTSDVWHPIAEKFAEMSDLDPEARIFKRYFIGQATEVQMDDVFRLRVPKQYISIGNFNKDLIITGVGSHMEVWNAEQYSKIMNDKRGDLRSVKDSLSAKYGNPFEERGE